MEDPAPIGCALADQCMYTRFVRLAITIGVSRVTSTNYVSRRPRGDVDQSEGVRLQSLTITNKIRGIGGELSRYHPISHFVKIVMRSA